LGGGAWVGGAPPVLRGRWILRSKRRRERNERADVGIRPYGVKSGFGRKRQSLRRPSQSLRDSSPKGRAKGSGGRGGERGLAQSLLPLPRKTGTVLPVYSSYYKKPPCDFGRREGQFAFGWVCQGLIYTPNRSKCSGTACGHPLRTDGIPGRCRVRWW